MFSQKQPRHHRKLIGVVDSLRSAFGFRLKRRRIASPYQSEVDGEDHEDFVWDVPNPFAPLDPTQAHLNALIQLEIARMRRYESVGPLQSLPDHVQPHDGWNEFESDEDSDDAFESDDEEDADADDEDDDSEDNDNDDSDNEDKHRDANRSNVIVLHTLPPRYTPSPLPPPPPSSDTASTDDGEPLWHDLAQVYNDLAEAEERARKARRDAHRSRLKALTV